MALFKAVWKIGLVNQAKPFHAVHSNGSTDYLLASISRHAPIRFRWKRPANEADPEPSDKPQPEILPARKILKVAIVGRPNAGKSTLINKILDMNLCEVSCKINTTRTASKVAYTAEDTQIVFFDTPGLLAENEITRYEKWESSKNWEKKVFKEVDIVGVIHSATTPKVLSALPMSIIRCIDTVPSSKPLFMILSKIDLVFDKTGLSKAVTDLVKQKKEENGDSSSRNVWNKFSKVFFISAVENIGVQEIVSYLLEQAKPGDWLFEPLKPYEKPLHVLVKDLVRAKVTEVLPYEMSYKCNYEVEYLEVNDLGEVICVVLIQCEKERYFTELTVKKKRNLRSLAKDIESDLYKILRRVFRLRIVVTESERKSRWRSK